MSKRILQCSVREAPEIYEDSCGSNDDMTFESLEWNSLELKSFKPVMSKSIQWNTLDKNSLKPIESIPLKHFSKNATAEESNNDGPDHQPVREAPGKPGDYSCDCTEEMTETTASNRSNIMRFNQSSKTATSLVSRNIELEKFVLQAPVTADDSCDFLNEEMTEITTESNDWDDSDLDFSHTDLSSNHTSTQASMDEGCIDDMEAKESQSTSSAREKSSATSQKQKHRRSSIENHKQRIEDEEEWKRMAAKHVRKLNAYNWWSRLNCPNKSALIQKCGSEEMKGVDLTPDDIELLPWVDGHFVNVSEMVKRMGEAEILLHGSEKKKLMKDTNSTTERSRKKKISSNHDGKTKSVKERQLLRQAYENKRKQNAYTWWCRLGHPRRKDMHRKIGRGGLMDIDLTHEDVERLPWIGGGFTVNMPKMMDWMAELETSAFSARGEKGNTAKEQAQTISETAHTGRSRKSTTAPSGNRARRQSELHAKRNRESVSKNSATRAQSSTKTSRRSTTTRRERSSTNLASLPPERRSAIISDLKIQRESCKETTQKSRKNKGSAEDEFRLRGLMSRSLNSSLSALDVDGDIGQSKLEIENRAASLPAVLELSGLDCSLSGIDVSENNSESQCESQSETQGETQSESQSDTKSISLASAPTLLEPKTNSSSRKFDLREDFSDNKSENGVFSDTSQTQRRGSRSRSSSRSQNSKRSRRRSVTGKRERKVTSLPPERKRDVARTDRKTKRVSFKKQSSAPTISKSDLNVSLRTLGLSEGTQSENSNSSQRCKKERESVIIKSPTRTKPSTRMSRRSSTTRRQQSRKNLASLPSDSKKSVVSDLKIQRDSFNTILSPSTQKRRKSKGCTVDDNKLTDLMSRSLSSSLSALDVNLNGEKEICSASTKAISGSGQISSLSFIGRTIDTTDAETKISVVTAPSLVESDIYQSLRTLDIFEDSSDNKSDNEAFSNSAPTYKSDRESIDSCRLSSTSRGGRCKINVASKQPDAKISDSKIQQHSPKTPKKPSIELKNRRSRSLSCSLHALDLNKEFDNLKIEKQQTSVAKHLEKSSSDLKEHNGDSKSVTRKLDLNDNISVSQSVDDYFTNSSPRHKREKAGVTEKKQTRTQSSKNIGPRGKLCYVPML